MEWNIEYTDKFGDWWRTLEETEEVDVTAVVELLGNEARNWNFHIHLGCKVPSMITCGNCEFRAVVARFGFSMRSIREEPRYC